MKRAAQSGKDPRRRKKTPEVIPCDIAARGRNWFRGAVKEGTPVSLRERADRRELAPRTKKGCGKEKI